MRLFGNDVAHGDFVSPVSEEEAGAILDLMTELLDEVYESPARIERVRARRERRKVEDA